VELGKKLAESVTPWVVDPSDPKADPSLRGLLDHVAKWRG
jgi:hypothetical protein